MSWIDFVFIVVAFAAIAIQSRRGFVHSVMDVGAGMIAWMITRVVCAQTEGVAGPFIAFMVLLGLLLAGSHFLGNMIAFEIEAYDALLGAIFGFVLACVVMWVMYWAGDGARQGGVTPDWIRDSRLAGAFYHYEWWKGFLTFMGRLGQY
jgi:hypothetical protein